MEQVWQHLRRPFRYPQAGHPCSWERFDADKAGCLLCGALHKCNGSMIGCKCPLAETTEGGHVCLITGLCISEVRSARCEFVDNVYFEQSAAPITFDDEGVHDKVASVIRHFLTSKKTVLCRRRDQEKHNLRAKQVFWRVLKKNEKGTVHTPFPACAVLWRRWPVQIHFRIHFQIPQFLINSKIQTASWWSGWCIRVLRISPAASCRSKGWASKKYIKVGSFRA